MERAWVLVSYVLERYNIFEEFGRRGEMWELGDFANLGFRKLIFP